MKSKANKIWVFLEQETAMMAERGSIFWIFVPTRFTI
jgi:hypothetical protein